MNVFSLELKKSDDVTRSIENVWHRKCLQDHWLKTMKCGFWTSLYVLQMFCKKEQFLWPMKIIRMSSAGIDREEVNSMKTRKGRKKIYIYKGKCFKFS